jgi:branched-chain amino acid transport system permease protein
VGPTIGAVVWLVLRSELQQITMLGSLWLFILGAIFVLLVTLLRKGLYGAALSLWSSRRERSQRGPVGGGLPVEGRIGPSLRTAPERPSRPTPFALEAREVCKAYGALRAVANVSFAVPYGEIYAVIGPNGAGKSTFLRLLSGEEPSDAGCTLLHGVDITGSTVTAACQLGLSKSYQINQLFVDLTARQNLRVGALARRRGALRFDIFRSEDSIAPVEHVIAGLIEELGLAVCADLPVHTLAYGEKRRLELGLALASQPSVLLLDEPLAGLSPSERHEITQLIRSLRAGRTIVLVEHDMDAVFALATRIMVLHEGRLLAEGPPHEIRRDPRVREAYLGGVAAYADA